MFSLSSAECESLQIIFGPVDGLATALSEALEFYVNSVPSVALHVASTNGAPGGSDLQRQSFYLGLIIGFLVFPLMLALLELLFHSISLIHCILGVYLKALRFPFEDLNNSLVKKHLNCKSARSATQKSEEKGVCSGRIRNKIKGLIKKVHLSSLKAWVVCLAAGCTAVGRYLLPRCV